MGWYIHLLGFYKNPHLINHSVFLTAQHADHMVPNKNLICEGYVKRCKLRTWLFQLFRCYFAGSVISQCINCGLAQILSCSGQANPHSSLLLLFLLLWQLHSAHAIHCLKSMFVYGPLWVPSHPPYISASIAAYISKYILLFHIVIWVVKVYLEHSPYHFYFLHSL